MKNLQKAIAIAAGLLAMIAVSAAAQNMQSQGCKLTIETTASGGVVWGSVMASYNGTSVTLAKAHQTLAVPCGTPVTLSETPTNPASMPFASWTGVSSSQSSNSTVQVTLSGPKTVGATYSSSSAAGSSSSSGGSSKSSWGG